MAGGQPPPTAVAAADALPAARVLAVLSEGCTDDPFFVGAVRRRRGSLSENATQ